jgi:hypothetical protein
MIDWQELCEGALNQSKTEKYANFSDVFPTDYDVDEDPFGDFVPKLYTIDTRSGQVWHATTLLHVLYIMPLILQIHAFERTRCDVCVLAHVELKARTYVTWVMHEAFM